MKLQEMLKEREIGCLGSSAVGEAERDSYLSIVRDFNKLKMPLSVTVVSDNAKSLPTCTSKTVRCYLLKSFPDLSTVSEDSRWESEPVALFSRSMLDQPSYKLHQPLTAPQRQDSFSLNGSSHHSLNGSSHHSAASFSSPSTTSSFSLDITNRRSFLVR